MPLFEYKALDRTGKKVSGSLTAEGPATARLRLTRERLFPVEVREVKAPSRKSPAGALLSRLSAMHRVNPAFLSTALRHLATLVSSGLPLVECLDALIEQTEQAVLKQTFIQVREKVVEGLPLSSAMAEHPAVFSGIFINMVRAGETGGVLDIVLKRLADFTEDRLKLRKKIHSAMAYPLFLFMISSVILVFLMSFVMPRVIGIFRGMELSLPWSTRLLIWLTHGIRSWWWLAGLSATALSAGAYAWVHTEKGGRAWDRARLRLPLFGRLHHHAVVARFTRTLSILLNSGIPLVEALATAASAMGNRVMEDAVRETARLVGEGRDLSGTLKKTGRFPPMVVQLVHAGEASGELEEMLARAADVYENEVGSSISSLTSIIEPAIILLMGFVVAFIVLAVLLPIFDMTSGIR